ncbi:hypothetical protein AMTRI_Chr01g127550 [Amborella trichopoda]|uniref:Glycoside hydrolase family 31 N-terminal domain-containing protein n=1 Tax=Amborella trichopoda TaxID=13333 RepID=W1NP42_AMBTC|nr:uncharacterized protein LOC18426104 [Amborella trichopoda]ERM98111.1 hypothetical protein AMTR_s00095p00030610 [Amborella trichopoda]|eukprot:XP_020517996.1 uncharacterized protein LOC18426104 [Amborella trichopoda]
MAIFKVEKKHHRRLNNPFPQDPNSLKFTKAKLFCNPHLPQNQSYHIGSNFLLCYSSENGVSLSISHQSDPPRSLWSTIPGQGFISSASSDTNVTESRGSFAIHDNNTKYCNHQTLEDIRLIKSHEAIREVLVDETQFGSQNVGSKPWFSGLLQETQFPILAITGCVYSREEEAEKQLQEFTKGSKNRGPFYIANDRDSAFTIFCKNRVLGLSIGARYWLLFAQKTGHQLEFCVEIKKAYSPTHPETSKSLQKVQWKFGQHLLRLSRDRGYITIASKKKKRDKVGDRELNRVIITYSSEGDERFYGFGEQFSHMEFKGKRVPILVQEQGLGRGDQPITMAANLVSYRSGGNWSTTYAPSPFYMTSKMRSLYLEGYNYSVFDLRKRDRVQLQVYGPSARGRILHGNSPAELIEQYTETIGRLPELPDWIISGAIVGMQGGTGAVRRVWDLLQQYDTPISAFWLQDWVGQRKTIIGSQLWWNWEVDTNHYAGWSELVKDLRSHDIRTMGYCNPCLAPVDEKPNKKKHLFEEAKKLDLFVKDKFGSPYMVPNTAFDVGMLDFTNPKSRRWFKQILQEMVDGGISGWMADFGEGLPLDACLYSGEDPISAHNRYPELWAEINREFVDEWKSMNQAKQREDSEESLVFFVRAGYRGSPKWASLFWEGDQMVSWQRNDGIKSAVVGLLSSGLSGYSLNHSDIGGYCAVNFPLIKYQRSEELLLRWMELNAFTTIFRTHEGNNPSFNTQFYSNRRTFTHFARFAKVYKAWKFYRIQLVKEAAQNGLPVTRHLFIHYPDDQNVHRLTYQQFLVGSEILVVPVLDKGKKKVKAYFPVSQGSLWQNIWTGKLYGNRFCHSNHTHKGMEAWVEAPIGYPAVFVKTHSPIGETFLKSLKDLQIL